MKNKKVVILIGIIVAVLLIVAICFGIRLVKTKKYQAANEYTVKGLNFDSVKSVVGEKKVKSYKYEKNETIDNGQIEKLTLKFIDAEKEATTQKYMDHIKENGNYIESSEIEEGGRQLITSDKNGVTTVETKLTDDGFILMIESGKGEVKVNVPD